MATTSERSLPAIFGACEEFSRRVFFLVKKTKRYSISADMRTHLLYEHLKHRPAIRHVAAEAGAARVRIIARKLLGLREVDAIVAHGEPGGVEAGRGRAADVHHHAVRVAVPAMHDVVLVEKAQALYCTSASRPSPRGVTEGRRGRPRRTHKVKLLYK